VHIGVGWDWYTDEEIAAICADNPTLASFGSP
jgi:hypothetical protein